MLLTRKYRSKSIDDAIQKVTAIERKELLVDRQKEKSDRIIFNLTYNPALPSISNILQKHWRALTQNRDMINIFPKPAMCGYRQPPNLKKMLCHAKVPPTPERQLSRTCNTIGLKQCGEAHCIVCAHVNPSPVIISSTNSKQAQNTERYTCNSTSVIYCISCTLCHSQYIGQTKRRLKDRIKEHIGYVRSNKNETGQHFNERGHTISHLKVQILEHVKETSVHRRLIRESHWIKQFCPILNTMD